MRGRESEITPKGDLVGGSSHTTRELSTPFSAMRHHKPGSLVNNDDDDDALRQNAGGVVAFARVQRCQV